ncbi:MAG: KH domain-containing protein [Clostridiales bacterium]|nr:KH domain-containing protein [Clostridiales bacterium]
MLELVEFLAKSLVEDPSAVRVSEKQEGDSVVIELNVAESDMGKVIGKQGRIAKAIRTVVKAASARTGKKYTVEIV